MARIENPAPWLVGFKAIFRVNYAEAKRIFSEDDATVHCEGWESANKAFERIYKISVGEARNNHLELTVDYVDHTIDLFHINGKLIYLVNIWAGEGEIREA